jgi:tripartite-type tricarboxylate transporter receptor subunit TctC
VWGPRGLPTQIAAQLAAEARKGFEEPDIKERFPPESFEVICSTPQDFARLIDAETARYRRIVHDAKISADRL